MMMIKTVLGRSMLFNLRRNFFLALLLALAWAASAPRAMAQYTWTTAASGNWSDTSNWTPNTSFPNSTTATVTIPTLTPPGYTITIDNTSDTINSLTVTGTDDVTITGGTLVMDGTNPFIDPGTSDAFHINSTLQLNQTTEISGGNGDFYLGTVTGTGGLTLNTPAGLIVSLSTASYTGATFLGDGASLFLAGGTAASSGFDLASNISYLQIDGNETINNLSGVAGASIGIGSHTLNVVNSTNTTYAGSIIDSGDGGSLVYSSSNGSTLILSGSNNYLGTTTVSSGTLQFGQEDSLYNGTTSSWTASNISVASGATLALNVGGTGEFTSSDISTLLTNLGTGTGGFASGSAIGFDTTDAGGNFTYASAITDTHAGANALGVVKLGTGTLTLTAANSYTGNTTVDAGTLAISGNSAAIDSPGATVYVGKNNGDNGTLAISSGGTVTDSTGFIGYSSGSTGNATVGTGSTWTNNSNLVIGHDGTGTLMVSGGGAVLDSTGYIGDDSGSTGNNSVTVTGTGSTWTNSSNLIVGHDGTGALTISAGGSVSDGIGYIGNNSDSTGNNNVTVTGTGSTWTNSGDVYVGTAGTGTLTVADGGTVKIANGTGTLQLAELTGSSGTLDIGNGGLSGTINAAAIDGGSGTAVVNFNHTDDFTLAASLTGSLSVNQTGSGQTTLSGSNTYSGGTTISAGTLVAASTNALGAGVVNQSGGTLETDNVHHVMTMGDGTNGFNQTAGTLVLNLNGAPGAASNDVVHVSGSAALGGNLTINYNAGSIAPLQSEKYTVITTTTGITSVGSGYNSPTLHAGALLITVAGEKDSLNPDNFDVTLTGSQTAFTALTGTNFTPNQYSVASYLDRFDGGTTLSGPIISLLQALDGISVNPSALGPYFDQLTPLKFESFTSSTAFNNASFSTQAFDNYIANHLGADGTFVSSNGGIDTSGLTVNDPNIDSGLQMIHSRLLAWSPAPSTGLLSDTPAMYIGGVDMKDTKAMVETGDTLTNPWNVFVSGNVVLAQDFSDPTAGLSHADATTGAVQLGADYRVTPNFLVGASFGYGHTDATLDNIGSTASVDTYSPGVYASYANGGWYANALGSYGFANYNQNRNVAIGAFTGTATSTPGGDQIVGDLDGGYDFHHGPWTFGPTLGAQYVHLDVDGFTETGLPGADLTVNQNEADSLRSSLGGRVSYAVEDGDVVFNPHLSASWQHEFLDQSRGITSQFSGVGAGSFVVQTPNPSRDSALVDVGLDTQVDKTYTVFADYTMQAGQSNYFGQSVQAGLKIGF